MDAFCQPLLMARSRRRQPASNSVRHRNRYSRQMGLTTLMRENPTLFVIILPVLLMSIVFQGFARAWTADKLGDSTPRRAGYLTLYPFKHLEPFGVLLLVFAGIGFAKPVPTNSQNLGRWGKLWVAAAGPISNLLIVLVALLIIKIVGLNASKEFLTVCMAVATVNIAIAVFNLFPIPPQDGSNILAALFPPLQRPFDRFSAHPLNFLAIMLFFLAMREPFSQIVLAIQQIAFNLIGL